MKPVIDEICSGRTSHQFGFQATTHRLSQVIDEKEAPIGVFDSGIGGLSVYLHLAEQLPNERFVYYADTLHVPYGNRDSEDIEKLTLAAVDWLYEQGCKLVVIACNSASAHALVSARIRYPQLPVVGLVPALKPAVLGSLNRHVAVLATKATLEGTLLNKVITDIAVPNNTQVTKYFDPELVPWVEAGMSDQSAAAENLRLQLRQFALDKVDYLVLGCTHYPFFKSFLLNEINAQQLTINVVDSGQAVATRVRHLLVTNDIVASVKDCKARYPLTFYASKYDTRLVQRVKLLLGEMAQVDYMA